MTPAREDVREAMEAVKNIHLWPLKHSLARILAAEVEQLRIELQKSEALVACKEYSEELLVQRAEQAESALRECREALDKLEILTHTTKDSFVKMLNRRITAALSAPRKEGV